jgi:hypothetical protein
MLSDGHVGLVQQASQQLHGSDDEMDVESIKGVNIVTAEVGQINVFLSLAIVDVFTE